MPNVDIAEIVVEKRARVSNGSLETLERSIDSLGVLHPIGITPDKKLIFGGRRLQACKNLGLETIPARVFDINADDPVMALRMERAENESRIDLTPSEKVDIAWRIEQVMEGRQGQRNDLLLKLGLPEDESESELPQIFGEVKVNKTEKHSREVSTVAAQAVGMNRETYRQAKAVVNSGDRDIIEAMDSGEKSVNAAFKAVKEKSNPDPVVNSDKPKQTSVPLSIRITLHNNPKDDAETLLAKGGHEYCTKLALALLKAAGHNVDLTKEADV